MRRTVLSILAVLLGSALLVGLKSTSFAARLGTVADAPPEPGSPTDGPPGSGSPGAPGSTPTPSGTPGPPGSTPKPGQTTPPAGGTKTTSTTPPAGGGPNTNEGIFMASLRYYPFAP